MPDTASGSVQVAATIAHAKASLWDLFLGAELPVQLIMVLLMVVSVIVWGIVFSKIIELRRLNTLSMQFERRFWKVKSVTDLQQWISDGHEPLSRMCDAALKEMELSPFGAQVTEFQIKSLTQRLDRQLAGVYHQTRQTLQRGVNFLATVGSAAPFVGLFGTVWGIMHSFQSIAMTKNTSIAVVAPGIAEALFATALGLIAAIPATIAYNRLSSKINTYLVQVERFADALVLMIERELNRGE